jgi:hypothetical protein
MSRLMSRFETAPQGIAADQQFFDVTLDVTLLRVILLDYQADVANSRWTTPSRCCST